MRPRRWESQDRYSGILDIAHVGIVTVDHSQTILVPNHGARIICDMPHVDWGSVGVDPVAWVYTDLAASHVSQENALNLKERRARGSWE